MKAPKFFFVVNERANYNDVTHETTNIGIIFEISSLEKFRYQK